MLFITKLKEKLIIYLLSTTGKIAVYLSTPVCTYRLYCLVDTERSLEIVDFIACHRKLGIALLTHLRGNLEKSEERMRLDYQGDFDSIVDFTQLHFTRAEPKLCYFEGYIDYEAAAKDLFKDEFFALEVDGRTHVFKNDD